jgi:hypothetical protein
MKNAFRSSILLKPQVWAIGRLGFIKSGEVYFGLQRKIHSVIEGSLATGGNGVLIYYEYTRGSNVTGGLGLTD